MGSTSTASVEAQGAGVLAAIGAWNVVVPYIAKLLGLDVGVAARVEVVDHVVPGVVVAAGALYLLRLARRGPWARAAPAILVSGACFLAGFWVLATHAPLIRDAAEGVQPWDAAIWHSVAALPIVGLALWCVLRSARES